MRIRFYFDPDDTDGAWRAHCTLPEWVMVWWYGHRSIYDHSLYMDERKG